VPASEPGEPPEDPEPDPESAWPPFALLPEDEPLEEPPDEPLDPEPPGVVPDPELVAPPPLDPDAPARDELEVPLFCPVETLPPEDDPHAASVATRAESPSFDRTEISVMAPEQWRQRAKSVSMRASGRKSTPRATQASRRLEKSFQRYGKFADRRTSLGREK
jgi:hypothetical protein